jgi:hypothetical protein
MKWTKRNKKGRKRTRRLRGGRIKGMKLPPDGPPNWPIMDGCKKITTKGPITLPIDSLLDRIGSTNGRFVAVLQRDIRTENPKPASYSSRSLRTLGETPYMLKIDGKDVDLREIIYKMIYKPENDVDNELYYVLRLKKPITIINPCKAAKAFGYPGGAFQLGLPKTVQELLDDGTLEKVAPEDMKKIGPGFPRFPPYTDDDDGKPAAFRPWNASLDPFVDLYYSTTAERYNHRKKVGADPTPDKGAVPHVSFELASAAQVAPSPTPTPGAGTSVSAASGLMSPTGVRKLFP